MEHIAIQGVLPSTTRGSVALLVDGDNMSAERAGRVLLKAAGLGSVIVKRVYSAAPHLKGWEKSYGFSLRYAQGAKNATDLLMTIEAVELAHRGDLRAFVLASSDRDFAPLARWLVEKGLYVLGLGGPLAPIDWQKSCSRFEVIEEPKQTQNQAAASSSATGKATSSSQAGSEMKEAAAPLRLELPLSETDKRVREIIKTKGQSDSIEIGTLGVIMGSQEKITLGSLGVANWRTYLKVRPELYRLDPKGEIAQVRWIGP